MQERDAPADRTPLNIIDLDAGKQTATQFNMPTAVRKVSLNEMVQSHLSHRAFLDGDRVARYLLVSQAGAVTLWHTDFSGTAVFYFLAKGVKVFYVVRATKSNLALFQQWLQLDEAVRRQLFFGLHPELEGGCRKVTVLPGQAIFMPGQVIHMVETLFDSVALG